MKAHARFALRDWLCGVFLQAWRFSQSRLGRVSLACLLTCAGSGLRAATITDPLLGPYQTIQPVSGLVRQGDLELPATTSLFNGSGLTSDNPLRASHGGDPADAWIHAYDGRDEPVTVEFDLGDEYLINEMWMWQLSGEGLVDRGIASFEIVMRDGEGRELGTVRPSAADAKTSGIQPVPRFAAFGDCVFLPFEDCVRYVELRILENRGSVDYVGLAEVMFAGRRKLAAVPEPTGANLLAIALVGLLSMRRRRS